MYAKILGAQDRPDPVLTACCAASLILVPLFVIGVTLALSSIAIAGEIADRVCCRKAALADLRTIANGLCNGRRAEKSRVRSLENFKP